MGSCRSRWVPASAMESIMPRRTRPARTSRSEHWLRVMVNERPAILNGHIARSFGWQNTRFEWKSPVQEDGYAEYFDQEFLGRLGVDELTMPLAKFWPASGPRWDALARTDDGKLILVEAKAHIDECVDFRSKASPDSLARITSRLDEAKAAFHASPDACWHTPLYQMANRLAHLYFLAGINKLDAYLVFVHFADAPDVDVPASHDAWLGAIRLARKCLGLKDSSLTRRVADVIVEAKEFCGPART